MHKTNSQPCEEFEEEGPEMVVIPAGRFDMGSPASEEGRDSDESPQHPVTLDRPFAMSRCEITVGQFRRFVDETGYSTEAEQGKGCFVLKQDGTGFETNPERNWQNPGFNQTDAHPVVCVSWDDALAYAEWLSARTGQAYRLPTEAEWEYAARAGTTSPFSTGDCITTDQANYDGTYDYAGCGAKTGVYRRETVPAGSLPPNPWGLHEVHGNAWEWVRDCWHENYTSAPKDGTAWESGGDCNLRVVRGGGWNNIPVHLRSAVRNRGTTDVANNFLGFRLARTL
ncbi:MAG: formylglycine-generating enzyme family protein [Candidatus Thiodiazotropha sp.]